MKIGIMSDIHGYPQKFKKAIESFKGCDMILCAGDILYHGPRNPILEGYNPQELIGEIKKLDIPMLIARGNCDADVDLMVLNLPILTEYIVYENNKIRFIVTHGHNVDEAKLKEIGKLYKANVVISGHTHIRKWEKQDDILIINPGSISIPRGEAIPSAAIYEDGIVSFINIETGEVIEKVK